jgi:serine/threonine-protein kinase
LHRWRRDVPTALEQVVLRALAKDPAARYRSAEAMAAALQAAARSLGPAGELRRPGAVVANGSSEPARPRLLALAGGATALSLAVVVVLALLAWAQLAGGRPAASPTATPAIAEAPEPPLTPTATPVPRPTPTPLPTPLPTPTVVPSPSAGEVLFGSLTLVPPTPPELRRFADAPALEFAPGEIQGAYLPYRDGALPAFARDLANAALLFGQESGAVQFVVPAGSERLLIEIEGRQSRSSGRPVLVVALGDRVVWQGQEPFPGPSWSRLAVVVAFDRLPGEVPVTLTLRNLGEPQGRGEEPWLAVRAVRVRVAS